MFDIPIDARLGKYKPIFADKDLKWCKTAGILQCFDFFWKKRMNVKPVPRGRRRHQLRAGQR
jgi:hypothetical protein